MLIEIGEMLMAESTVSQHTGNDVFQTRCRLERTERGENAEMYNR